MVRNFCDCCGNELTSDNVPSGPENRGMLCGKTPNTGKLPSFQWEVLVGMNGIWNDGELCKYCIIDLVNAADDRPVEA